MTVRLPALLLLALAPLFPQTPDFEGRWLGTLDAGPNKLRIALRLARTPGGGFSCIMNSLDQNPADILASKVTVNGRTIVTEFPQIGGSIEVALRDDAKQLAGNLRQAGVALPIVFERTESAIESSRPQEPRKPYPYDEREVNFEYSGVKLAATLTLPRTKGPHPAVLLLTGSGAQDRNESAMGHRPFLVLADFLTRRGIAVLRADDRGVGGSTGNLSAASLEDLASDALAGVAWLKARPEIDPARVGLIGHSEGGVVAALAAGRSRDVSFVVLMAGTGLPGDQVVLSQVERLSKAGGVPPEMVAQSLAIQRKLFDILKHEPDNAIALEKMGAALPEAARKMKQVELKMMTSVSYRSFIGTDPAAALVKVKSPVLALAGELDTQVPPDENLPAIAAALKRNRRANTLRLPGLNHLFQKAKTGSISEYRHIEETINPAALDAVGEWIAKQTAR
ncbi:MAG TPA: alpha/beta fold hydrolase [Bryobacteraceae bacterium]|nr:alpha/beta fold hydrolase [Bryobacteraceae bacterium]